MLFRASSQGRDGVRDGGAELAVDRASVNPAIAQVPLQLLAEAGAPCGGVGGHLFDRGVIALLDRRDDPACGSASSFATPLASLGERATVAPRGRFEADDVAGLWNYHLSFRGEYEEMWFEGNYDWPTCLITLAQLERVSVWPNTRKLLATRIE